MTPFFQTSALKWKSYSFVGLSGAGSAPSQSEWCLRQSCMCPGHFFQFYRGLLIFPVPLSHVSLVLLPSACLLNSHSSCHKAAGCVLVLRASDDGGLSSSEVMLTAPLSGS